MGFVSKAFTFALLIVLAAGSFAFVTDSPSYLSVGERPQDFSIQLENTSTVNKPLLAEFTLPSKFEVLEKPDFVRAKGKAQIRFRVYPQQSLEGTSYTGKIRLTLGGDVAEKIVTARYFSENGCTIDAQSGFAPVGTKAQGAADAGFVETLTFTNGSYKPKTLRLTQMRNAPQDWKTPGGQAFEVGPFETRSFSIPITAQSAFEGKIAFVFNCADSQLIKRQDVSVKMAAGADSNVIASGFAVVAGAIKSGEGEFILNAFLLVIAAVLLIAFIARLVNFLNRKNGGAA